MTAARHSVGDRLIHWYGSVAERGLVGNRAFARAWLMAGFHLQTAKVSHVPFPELDASGNRAYALFMRSIVGALDDPAHAVLTSIFTPDEMFHAMGLLPMTAEAVASFASGAQAEGGFLAETSGHGLPDTYCTYHRLLLGMADTGVLRPVPMLASTSVACDANNITFKALAGAWGVPHCYIDVPYDVSRDAMLYVADQLREMAAMAQDCYHRTLDPARLVEACRLSEETDLALEASLPARRGRYLANTMTIEMMRMLDETLLLGTPGARDLSLGLLDDLAHAPAYDGLNLVWAHVSPYFLASVGELIDCSPRAQIVASDMAFTHLSPEGGRTFSPESPYEYMAERVVRNCFNGPSSRRVACLVRLARATAADGVVLFCHWGCKQTAGSAQIVRREVEAAGWPVLVLDGDACDRANCMEGQLTTRLTAFLELLDARREGVAARG